MFLYEMEKKNYIAHTECNFMFLYETGKEKTNFSFGKIYITTLAKKFKNLNKLSLLTMNNDL
jgi:hypothetical protein